MGASKAYSNSKLYCRFYLFDCMNFDCINFCDYFGTVVMLLVLLFFRASSSVPQRSAVSLHTYSFGFKFWDRARDAVGVNGGR